MDEQISLINHLISRNVKNENSLNGLKKKIEYIENLITKKNDITNAIKELDYIKNILDKIISNFIKSREECKKLAGNFFFNFMERNNYKKKTGWGDYIKYSLINRIEIDENNKSIKHFTNVLTDAAIYGLDGTLWAKSGNFNISESEFKKTKELFNKNENNNESIEISGIKYNIIKCEDNFIELKHEDFCGSISKSEKGIIFGLYNLKKKYKENGKAEYQNKVICNKTVKNLSEILKKKGL